MAINKKSGEVLEFSNFSEYLCHADSNGVLRVWDSSSGVLRQEYVSSGHLSSRCHCLAWSPSPTNHLANDTPKKKKKRLSAQQDSLGSLQLVAMGTSTGSILLYSVKKGDLHKTLSGVHEGCVVDVCWSKKGERLFSCSRDGLVVCWDVEGACVESQWNAGTGLSSIHLCTSQEHLLTAGRTIQLWHLQSKSLLQSFQGHTTDVLKMVEVPCTSHHHVLNGGGGGGDDDRMQGIEGSYILSMAADENKISVRQVSKASNQLLASFSLPDMPLHFHHIHPNKQLLQMVVVTRGGSLAYFECHLNGRHKKPIKAKIVTTITTPDATATTTRSAKAGKGGRVLPVLTAKLLQGGGAEAGDGVGGPVLCVLYADVLKPAFDRISVGELEERLVRQDPRSSKVTVQESVVKIKTPTVDNDVMLLTSSSLQASRKDASGDVRSSRKRKKSFSQSQDEITLGEQLALITKPAPSEATPPSNQATPPSNQATPPSNTTQPIAKTATTTQSLPTSQQPLTTTTTTATTTVSTLATATNNPPFTPIKTPASSAKTDSLALLLGQGLQSADKKILNNVLQKTDYLVIRSTVARLPPQCVHALLKELSRRVSGHAQSGKAGIRWMKALLAIHSSYLSTVPDIEELLSPLLDHLEPSLEVLTKMMVLKGKLDCMSAQFKMLTEPSNNQATPSQPALSTIDPIEDDDDDIMTEDVRHLEISDEDEWEDETETVVTNTKDSKSSHKTSDFSDGEGSDNLMEAD